MTDLNQLAGWELPSEILVSRKDFIQGHMTVARDSVELFSPEFNDREEAFEWLKKEAAFMSGNAILNLNFSDVEQKGSYWFSGQMALIAKRTEFENIQDARASRVCARNARKAFYKEQVRVQKEREEERAQQAALAAKKMRRNKLVMKASGIAASLMVATGLVYALPL
jgi:uncharacterized protein YbjQ (UPF0145 family)